jgi:hypothetical protein
VLEVVGNQREAVMVCSRGDQQVKVINESTLAAQLCLKVAKCTHNRVVQPEDKDTVGEIVYDLMIGLGPRRTTSKYLIARAARLSNAELGGYL